MTTDTLILTGGFDTSSTVTRYDAKGFLEDLPSLNEGRRRHGCGAYMREDGTKVIVCSLWCPDILFRARSNIIFCNPFRGRGVIKKITKNRRGEVKRYPPKQGRYC